MSAHVQRTREGRQIAYEWRCRECSRQSPGTWMKERDAERSARAHNAQRHKGTP